MNTPSGIASLSIKARISLGFAVILLMMVILTVIGVIRVNNIDGSLTTISDVAGVKQRYAINFRGSVHDRAINLRDVALVTDQVEMTAAISEIDRLGAEYAKSAELLDKIFAERNDNNDEERQILAGIKEIEAKTLPLARKVIDTALAGNHEQAGEFMLKEAKPAFVEWLARINKFIDFQEKMVQAEAAKARDIAQSFEAQMLALCVAALVIGVVVATVITRQIIRSLGAEPAEVKSLAEAVGRGELYHEVRLRPGDRDSIMATLAGMTGTLRNTVTGVRRAAEGVADTSDKIAQGNQDLSSRTEQQACALEQTAASMDQLGSTVKQNADNAQQANQLAQGAQQVALKGGEVVGQVVETMKGINEGSRRISDIIGVIEGIAFQTNILALNASVEAARAGEQGRGFAVVASEVRNLAQRSSAAAHEIKNLITESVERVERGTALVDRAGATMDDIVSSIKRVTDIMGEISTASAEQSQGVNQVSVAVAEMDRATQQNAGQVEESAAFSESLRVQAQELLQAVAVFRLDQERRRSLVA